MSAPRKLKVSKPVKLIFAGGFLGAGKTTALAAVARKLIADGKRVGIITNDQTENLADTVIVREMLGELGVPVEEVVKGCFCCKFDELVDHMEKILVHDPDILLGEPVGSCTDFVAAVANPLKIHYKEAFRFAPFSTLVDPDRLRELLLKEGESGFPEEVAYLFGKQLEEADIIVINKSDLLAEGEEKRLLTALEGQYPAKTVLAVSAKMGTGMDRWVELLLSGRPGEDTVLRQIDYDRYATAEAVLGWLNAAVRLSAPRPFDPAVYLNDLILDLREAFRDERGEIGHLKMVLTSAGKSLWANLTHINAEPSIHKTAADNITSASLIVNARVRLDPDILEKRVRQSLDAVAAKTGITAGVEDLQCFSPAYPEPPYVIRDA